MLTDAELESVRQWAQDQSTVYRIQMGEEHPTQIAMNKALAELQARRRAATGEGAEAAWERWKNARQWFVPNYRTEHEAFLAGHAAGAAGRDELVEAAKFMIDQRARSAALWQAERDGDDMARYRDEHQFDLGVADRRLRAVLARLEALTGEPS